MYTRDLIFVLIVLIYLITLTRTATIVPNVSITTLSPYDKEYSKDVNHIKNIISYFHEKAPPECIVSINRFSNELTDFIKCTLINSVPFQICISCVRKYRILNNAYDELQKSKKCPPEFLGDKVLMLHHTYQDITSQWTSGNCQKCFRDDVSIAPYTLSNDTRYYFSLLSDLNSCVESNIKDKLKSCDLCKSKYHFINDYYNLISSNYSNKVCYDIIDAMNNVRLFWTNNLKCPSPTNNSYTPLIIVFIVLLTPVGLYLGGKLFCLAKGTKIMKQKRLASSYKFSSQSNEITPLIKDI